MITRDLCEAAPRDIPDASLLDAMHARGENLPIGESELARLGLGERITLIPQNCPDQRTSHDPSH